MNQKSHVHVANRVRIWLAWILALLLWIQGTSFPVRAEEPPSSSFSFENTILSVSWKVHPEWNSEFQPIDSAKPIEIKPNDTYQLAIKYELPQGTLTAESPSCSYQLPSQLTFLSPVSGTIQNGGTAVGTYSINTSGQVVLRFFEDLVSENADRKVYGDLQFDIQGKEIILDDSTETVIRFNDSNQFTLTGPVLDPDPEKGSLQVQKTGEKKEGRTMSYTITVTATGDTTEDVVVTDVLKSGSATYKENSLVVKKNNGTPVSPVELSFQDQSFQLTLPPLSANESYTITYEMEADSLKNETNTIKNYVEAQTGANKTGSWGPDLTFTNKMLEKTGVLQADKKTILWMVTLNEANEDLNGWTLQDEWNQIPVKEVSIKPSVDGKDKIPLPYTFSSTDTTTYTITYTTPADVLLGTSQTLNKVVLEKGEEKIEQETGVYVPDSEDAQPIQKEGVALKPIGPNLYEAEWMVRLNLDYSSLSPGWTYTDRLSGDGTSSYSAEQKKALMEAIANAFGVTNQGESENGFTSDIIDFSWVKEEWESEAKTFQITGKTSLPQGKTIEFTYCSTVEIEEGNLYNNGVLKDRGKEANASGELTVKPILRKNDPLSPGSSWTYHSRKELKDDILRWEVVVNIPEHQTKALTLVDTLPDEVTYSNAFVKDMESEPAVQGNTVTWTLDEAFVQANQGKTITFVVEAKLVEQNLTWRNDETTDPKIQRIHVKNQAEIIQEEDPLKKVEQTQTIWESTVRNRIEKTDPKASGKETAHRFEELENGQVVWKIAQYIEEDQTKPLTVQDSIPQGLQFEEGNVRCDGKEVDADFTLQENTLSLALDEQFIGKWRGKTLELTLAFSIEEDFSWNVDPDHPKNATGLFKNECQVLEEGTVVDTDEQTQTITKNLFENALKKTGNYDSSTGVLSYTVVINPDGKTFGGEDGLIHLHDRLKYHYKGDYDSYRVYFMPEKTVLYEVAGDGEKKEIDRKDWHLRYKIGPEQWNPDMQQIDLDLDVPDGKSLELTYCYQVWGRKTLEQSIGNSIELTVNDKSYAESSTSVAAKTITSSANAGTHYVTLRKVDEQDVNVFLPGAKFDLYRYDKEKNDYVKENDKSAQVSNANGTIQFNDLAFNTAYYLKEIEAPSGYLLDETPFYFYIVGADTSSTTCMPDGFETDPNTHTYMNQSNLYITNKANTTSLTVRKKWLNAQGVELSGPTQEAMVDLIRYTHDEPPDDSFQYSLNIKSNGTVLLEQTNVPVKKGSVLEITFELLNGSSVDGIIHDQNWNGYSPVESISGIPGEETWHTYTRFTYRIPLQENNLILTAESWGLRFPKVTLIEPELNGTVIKSIPLNNQNDYKTTINGLVTEENIDGKKVYYTYDVQEQPMAGFDATYEKLTTETGVEIVVTNRRKENGGFVFPETGANKNQISAYVGGVMIASLICVRIWNRRKSKER